MPHVFHAAMNDCMPGIIAALAADNDVRLRSKHVDNLAFALVAPLHSDQNCVCHVKSKMGPPASLGEALRAGKKFSRRILRDTVGTCPQIISWGNRRETVFTAGLCLLPLSGRDSALRCPPKAVGAGRRPYPLT